MSSRAGFVPIRDVISFETILSNLTKLETKLHEDQLRQFQVFNTAYYQVTNAIRQAAKDGFFENEVFIEQFTVCFAHYYFQAVNDTVRSDPDIPTVWAFTNEAAKYQAPNFIFLLMGANAHINHDLPLALTELMGTQKPETLLKDVFKIDKILLKTGRQVLDGFEESNRWLDFLKRHGVFLYYRPVMYLILYWRIKAWRNYRAIKKHGLQDSQYAQSSVKTAKWLLKLAKFLG